jgi:acyl-coenzyme A synthetase/AMP-(fatty) acid ligase
VVDLLGGRPDSLAISCAGQSWTYAELRSDIEQASRSLPARAEALSLQLGNGYHDLVALLAGLRSGLPLLVLDDSLPERRTQEVWTSLAMDGACRVGDRTWALRQGRLGELGTAASMPVALLTSGTTGPERVVVHSLSRLFGRAALLNPTLDSSNTWLQVLRVASIAGFVIARRALAAGDHLVLAPSFEPRTLLENCRLHGVSLLAAPPAVLGGLCDVHSTRHRALPSLRSISLGSAPVDPEARLRAEQCFGVPVLSSFGSTELGGPVMTSLSSRSGGFRLLSGVEIAVRDEHGEVHPRGEGLLGFRCPTSCVALIADSGAISRVHADDWIWTGDVGRVGEDGLVVVDGRTDEVVLVAGRKVNCQQVIAALESFEEISRASVQFATFGEGLRAKVTLRRAALGDDGLARTLQARLRLVLPAHAVPVQIEFVSALPLTANLKVRSFMAWG